MRTFSKVDDPSVYLAATTDLIALSREHQPHVAVGWDSIACLIYDAEEKTVFSWLDDVWSFMHAEDIIISELNEELPWILGQAGVDGLVTVVFGQLKDESGAFAQAYSCTCNVDEVTAALSA